MNNISSTYDFEPNELVYTDLIVTPGQTFKYTFTPEYHEHATSMAFTSMQLGIDAKDWTTIQSADVVVSMVDSYMSEVKTTNGKIHLNHYDPTFNQYHAQMLLRFDDPLFVVVMPSKPVTIHVKVTFMQDIHTHIWTHDHVKPSATLNGSYNLTNAEDMEPMTYPDSEDPKAEHMEPTPYPYSDPKAECMEPMTYPDSDKAECMEPTPYPYSDPQAEYMEPMTYPDSDKAECMEPTPYPYSDPKAEYMEPMPNPSHPLENDFTRYFTQHFKNGKFAFSANMSINIEFDPNVPCHK